MRHCTLQYSFEHAMYVQAPGLKFCRQCAQASDLACCAADLISCIEESECDLFLSSTDAEEVL